MHAHNAYTQTGLGGVRDATNVFGPEQLEAAVVTTLDRVRTQRVCGCAYPGGSHPYPGPAHCVI